MKIIIIVLIWLGATVTYAQKVAYRYYINSNNIGSLLYGDVNSPGTAVTPTLCPNDKRLKCNISIDKGIAYVDFWGFPSAPPANCTTTTAINQTRVIDNTHKYFFDFRRTSLVPYSSQIRALYGGLNYGLLTIPLKIRPSLSIDSAKNAGISDVPLSASASFNLGVFVGGTIGRSYISYKGVSNYAFSVAAFVGPTAVELKEGNVNSFNTEFKKDIGGSKSVVLPAITYGIAMIGSYNAFGLVAAVGFDSPFGKGREYWYYREKVWIGLGFVANLPM